MGAVLVSTAGLTIVSTLPETVEADVMAAMTAFMVALGERTIKGLWESQLSQVLIKGQERTYALVEKVNSQVTMLALANQEAKLGVILMNMGITGYGQDHRGKLTNLSIFPLPKPLSDDDSQVSSA